MMEAAKGDDGNGLCICPSLFSPELLCEDDGPHGVFAVWCCGLKLSLVTDITVHAAFDHGEKHSLDGTIGFVVLRAQVCSANIG